MGYMLMRELVRFNGGREAQKKLTTVTGLLLGVLVRILIGKMTKYREEQLKERDYLFWLTVSEGSVNPGGQGMVEQLTSRREEI